MPSHRLPGRRGEERPPPSRTAAQPDTAAAGVSVEEGFLPAVDTLPRPAGFGTEASTSQQSSQLVDEYSVPAGTVAEIVEVSLSIEGNGQARVSAPNVTYGPYTGAVDVEVRLQGTRLTEGDRVRVFHQSTDGVSTTTLAQLVALEV